jgi:hypothetical protein
MIIDYFCSNQFREGDRNMAEDDTKRFLRIIGTISLALSNPLGDYL